MGTQDPLLDRPRQRGAQHLRPPRHHRDRRPSRPPAGDPLDTAPTGPTNTTAPTRSNRIAGTAPWTR